MAQLLRVGLIPRAHMIADALRAMLEKFNVPDVGQLPPLYQLQARLHTAKAELLEGPVHELEQAVQYLPEVRQWFQRWKRKEPLRVARALVAKELAKSVYVVLSQGVDFDQQFKGTPLTKRKQASWPRRASPSA